jgi:hypothetical protein
MQIRGIADSERAAKHAAAQAKVASLGGLSVMGEIKEKVFETNINIQPLAPVAGIASSGFPSSFKTSSTSTGSQSTGKKSLFAQQMQAKKAGVPFVPEPTKAPESKARVAFVEPADDAVEDSHSLNFDAISAQNDKRLAAMSAAEIEAARAEILSSLSPELMSLLQSRGLVQNTASEFNTSAPLAAFPNITDAAEVEDEQLAEPEPAMPSVADQLLAWTQPVDTDASFEPKVESTSAIDAADRLMAALERSPVAGWRFDLDGNRLSAEAQRALPSHLGLHHHGDAPGLAGYTIAELLHLTRSRMAAQVHLNDLLCFYVSFENFCSVAVLSSVARTDSHSSFGALGHVGCWPGFGRVGVLLGGWHFASDGAVSARRRQSCAGCCVLGSLRSAAGSTQRDCVLAHRGRCIGWL